MKVEVETKITILEGEEEGRTFVEKTIANTDQRYTEYGIIETLRYEWNKLVPYKYTKLISNELSELKGEVANDK